MNKNSYITFNNLDKYPNLINLYTKRPFDFNRNKLTKEKIEEQKDELRHILNLENIPFVNIVQTHTNNIAIINEDNVNDTFLNTDGAITNLKNVALTSVSADCQSILIYDKEKEVIANIHSGWKGTVKKILRNAINLMIKTYNCNPKDLIVAISPSIGPCCFEIESDALNEFASSFPNIENHIIKTIKTATTTKYYLDTLKINHDELINLGVLEENINLSNICTKCSSNIFHSYRKDDQESGRNLCLIAMR